MSGKIIVFLGAVCVILGLALFYTTHRIKSLKGENSDLRVEVSKRDKDIEEMNELRKLYQEVKKDNEKFKEQLNEDKSDNLDVVPADYIVKRLRAD